MYWRSCGVGLEFLPWNLANPTTSSCTSSKNTSCRCLWRPRPRMNSIPWRNLYIDGTSYVLLNSSVSALRLRVTRPLLPWPKWHQSSWWNLQPHPHHHSITELPIYVVVISRRPPVTVFAGPPNSFNGIWLSVFLTDLLLTRWKTRRSRHQAYGKLEMYMRAAASRRYQNW